MGKKEWSATAAACAKVDLIQPWGIADLALNIPANGAIALTLAELEVMTTVKWRIDLTRDRIIFEDKHSDHQADGRLIRRISEHLDHVRRLSGQSSRAEVVTRANFSFNMGISLYAPLFASLTMAAVDAAGQKLAMRDMTALARLGAGPACQCIPGGFVVWHTGKNHESAYAERVVPVDHWSLVDLFAVVSSAGHKIDSLDKGHRLAPTSPFQSTRLMGATSRLSECSQAIQTRDFERLAAAVELDSRLIRAVTLTSSPPLFYWAPCTLTIIDRVHAWRSAGMEVCYCISPGPNVHCLCSPKDALQLEAQLQAIPGVLDVHWIGVGGPARLID